jgi:cysteine synthase B
MIVENITDLIGNTAIIKIPAHVHGLKNIDLYGKLEMMNPFGSVKDRIAWGMIKDDIEDIKAKGQTIFENSSGNTAKALQAIASMHGLETKLITYLAKVDQVKDVVRMMGAEIEEVLGGSECFDPNDPNDPQFLIERAVKDNPGGAYFPSQFTNEKNPQVHYETTGKEIVDDLGSLDYFYGGLGTSGSTLGVARRVREHANPDMVLVGICAAKNDFIPGIRSLDQMWESGLFEKQHYNDFVYIDSGEACDATMELVKKCGILCGPTSGANYLGALKHLRTIDESLTERKSAAFIVCDRLEWYTEYMRERRPALFHQAPKAGSIRAFTAPANDAHVIKAEEAALWTEQNKPMIIDVRGNLSYKMMTLPNAINIPLELLDRMVDSADPFPKDQKIMLICPVGEKTAHYAAYLQSRGYDAFTLGGGILQWRNMSNPLKKVA